ncbi:MAG: winged helix-turn-helix transcriptional regulator [Candidatus Diapherotrites archaeon]
MKRLETFFNSDKKYAVIMILCFIYGGYAILSFLLQAYTAFWRIELLGFPMQGQGSPRTEDFNRFRQPDSNRLSNQRFITQEPLAQIVSPLSLSWLLSGIISLLAGLSIWHLVRKKEIKKIKQETANNLLLPDERKIIETLKKSNFEMLQSRIAKETGLSKVQVHRAIKRLEAKGILEKHTYGLSNKIMLKREFFD